MASEPLLEVPALPEPAPPIPPPPAHVVPPPAPPGAAATQTSDGSPADAATPPLDRLGVLPWTDDVGSPTTHDPRSAYVETFWLPILGPSTTLLVRRMAAEFEHSPEGFEMDCIATSRELGLGTKMTRRSPFVRTIDRCVKFNLAQLTGGVLYVRQRMLPLSYHQIGRLSNRLQQLHQAWTIDPRTDGEQRRTELVRATHLARTLLSLGESATTAEEQLHRWHFHPSISWHAVQWAQTDHSEDLR